jgi:hypothetical protein
MHSLQTIAARVYPTDKPRTGLWFLERAMSRELRIVLRIRNATTRFVI